MATAKTSAADRRIDARIQETVKEVIKEEFDHYLKDLSFRIGQAYDLLDRAGNGVSVTGKVYAEDLNLQGRAFMTGYTVTNNSPVAGSFAWADLHVVYNGADSTITNGSTPNKYVWWSSITTPTVLQTGNVKPVLTNGEVLLFMNINGTPQVMLSDTNASMPGVLRDGAVDAGSIIANAVTTAAIADNAVGSGQLGANAVTSASLADNAVVRAAQLAANVVTSTKLADGALVRAGQVGANVITSTALADGAVVRTGQLASNVVTSTKLADGSIVRAGQLTANVVTTSAIAGSAVTANELATGAVGATKLSILRHVLY